MLFGRGGKKKHSLQFIAALYCPLKYENKSFLLTSHLTNITWWYEQELCKDTRKGLVVVLIS